VTGTVATVTIVRGRHQHLARQHEWLDRGTRVPDHVVVVAMSDATVGDVVRNGPLSSRARLTAVPTGSRLPLAAARNHGATVAFEELEADLAVFLDVDCLPGPDLLTSYIDAHHRTRGTQPRLLNGPVCYLDPPGRGGYTEADLHGAEPHPARPAPETGQIVRSDEYHLFWSLSFAVDQPTWVELGGFDERYTGYGGEDTDFGQRARAVGAAMWWVGSARAHHQWHPVSDPPVEHVEDIVRNANLFHQRWGWFPMGGWLASFAEQGLAHLDEQTSCWRVADRPLSPAAPSRR
jgi:N-acetylglucosaminyl-diphospho-decaprenol L-rhamnosyltransferase